MLYVILTGRAPYEGGDHTEVIRKAIAAKPSKPREINSKASPALEAICVKAMSFEPETRYGSATELSEEIRRWLDDEPVHAYADSVVAKAGRWSRRNRSLVAAALVLLVVSTVATGVGSFLISLQKAQTEQALGRSEENVRIMGLFVQKMLGTVSGSGTILPAVPQVEDFRRGVALEAVKFYEDVLRNNSQDAALVRASAVADREAGHIHRSAREMDLARSAFQKAVRVLKRKAEPAHRDLLANIHLDLGEAEQIECHYDRARAEFLSALALAKILREESPQEDNFRRLEARCWLTWRKTTP